ncbi:hypothetical protein BLNAU_20954 [Blattamonas nauphoetae]|uniref:Uncharacterized protein n=1 Tax=Blattamonas nauphoetae TaxID=2049346 RepID=A0ABQ9WXB4_9EUKA|nr:hypothetical protein BLNAU_20954 [Blattamonas nauphoetae]
MQSGSFLPLNQSIRTISANLIHFLQLHSFLFFHLIQRCLCLVLPPTEDNDDDDSEEQSDEEARDERDQPAQNCLLFFGHRLLFWVFWFCVVCEDSVVTTTGMELLAGVRMTDLIMHVVLCVWILSSPTATNSSVSAVVAGDSTTTANTASFPLSPTTNSYDPRTSLSKWMSTTAICGSVVMMCPDMDVNSGAMGVVNVIRRGSLPSSSVDPSTSIHTTFVTSYSVPHHSPPFAVDVHRTCGSLLSLDASSFLICRTLQPALDECLETKAVKLLESVTPKNRKSADGFISSLASDSDEYSTDFIQSLMVLISSPSQAIIATAMKMLQFLIIFCSPKIRLTLVKADLIPQLIITLNPLSLPFDNAVDIHNNLMITIIHSLWLSTLDNLARLKIDDPNEQKSVHKTIFQQVVTPSEQYIRHLCVNCFSIIDGTQSRIFLSLLVHLLQICPYYQPTMDFLLNMPIFLTIPSYLTFFEADRSIWDFLNLMVDAQREWNKTRGVVRQMVKKMHSMLRMEGIEDAMEEKLQNDETSTFGEWIVSYSIEWNNLLGINIPKHE